MQKNFLSLALLGALALNAHAAVAGPLSLDEAIRHALNQNTELRVANRQARAADARADAAKGAFLPQIDVRYLMRRSDNPLDAFADKLNTRSVTSADFDPASLNNPDTSTLHATQLSVELPLYTGGRLRAGRLEAGAYADAARLNYERRQQVTVYNTLHAYRAAQAAAYAVMIANDAVEAAREHAETTARLVRQGRIVASDRITAELNLASSKSMYEQATNRQRLAIEDLRLVTGLPANDELLLPAWAFPAAQVAVPMVAENEQHAFASRKDLKASEALVRASRTKITAARAVFHPQIGVIAADTWYDDNAALDNKSQSIMGVVSMNLFNGGRDWHGLTAAQHDTEQSELRLEGLQHAVRSEVRAAASRLTEATGRRNNAAQNVDKAHENVRLVKQRYGEGRTILIDLLMAERMLVEARNEELTASLGQELSAAQLQLAEGSLPLPGEITVQ
jgi:outer membrane protein TolC